MKNLNIENTETRTDEWLTPPEIIRALGEFDLDPCSPINRPWDTAKQHFTINDHGLLCNWEGRVWLNPPYSDLEAWLNKLALHENGIALAFSRTDTKAFQQYVFPYATSIFFFQGRLYFYDVKGQRAKANAGAPSVLIAYNDFNSESIDKSGLKGFHIPLNSPDIYIFHTEDKGKTWKLIVRQAVEELGNTGNLEDIYEKVLKIAPERARRNKHYKEKIRQTLQFYFDRVEKGVYSKN